MALYDNIQLLNTWANNSRLLLSLLENDIDTRTLSEYNKGLLGGMGHIVVSLRTVMFDLIDAVQYFVYGNSSSSMFYKWLSVHSGLYDRAEPVTWKAICEAWVKDDFEGKEWTIAIIDRMRTLMWDEPFNIKWAASPTAEHT